MNRILIGTLLIGLLSACASTPSSSTQPGSLSSVKGSATNNTAATPTKVQQSGSAPSKDPSNSLLSQKRSVFFEFDQYVVGNEYRSMIDAHAKYLAANRSQKIKI